VHRPQLRNYRHDPQLATDLAGGETQFSNLRVADGSYAWMAAISGDSLGFSLQ